MEIDIQNLDQAQICALQSDIISLYNSVHWTAYTKDAAQLRKGLLNSHCV